MRPISLILLLALLMGMLSGCAPEQYSATYFDLFDTVTTVVGLSEEETEFSQKAQGVYDRLLEYHRLFDIYQEYPGITNLKTVNDKAGQAPVKVDPAILALLKDCKEYYTLTQGKVNVAMGSVLQLWHQAREQGLADPGRAALPDRALLEEAARHTDLSQVILDEEALTVFFADPQLRLDVGAVAKGWACQQVAQVSPEGLLINVGGNVCATGAKDDKGSLWKVGIQDPEGGSDYLHTLGIANGSLVTSGDYQRTYRVEGKDYHHIIDPDTLLPGELWRSVTVACYDAALADALSTSLFLMPLDQGLALLEQLDARAMWVDDQGREYLSPGFEALIQ